MGREKCCEKRNSSWSEAFHITCLTSRGQWHGHVCLSVKCEHRCLMMWLLLEVAQWVLMCVGLYRLLWLRRMLQTWYAKLGSATSSYRFWWLITRLQKIWAKITKHTGVTKESYCIRLPLGKVQSSSSTLVTVNQPVSTSLLLHSNKYIFILKHLYPFCNQKTPKLMPLKTKAYKCGCSHECECMQGCVWRMGKPRPQ